MAAALSLAGSPTNVADILVRAGVLSANQSRAALMRQSQTGAPVGRCAVELGFAEPARIADALAQAFRCPRVVLAKVAAEPAARARLDASFCRERVMLPLALREGGAVLVVAVADPSDRDALCEAARRAGCTIRPVVATEPEIMGALVDRFAPRRGITLSGAEEPEMETESLAASLVEAPANDAVGRTPAPAAPLPVDAQLAILNERLQWTESELRRTQRLLRGLLELCLAKDVATRAELSELLAKSRA